MLAPTYALGPQASSLPYEPGQISLYFSESHLPNSSIMEAPTTPPLDFDHHLGDEIPTKHKEAIRQLYGFAKVPIKDIMARYKLGRATINRVLSYDAPERARPTRTGAPKLLTDLHIDEIIEYLSESWNNRVLNWTQLRDELKLTCTPETLATRLKQRGYYRCTAC